MVFFSLVITDCGLLPSPSNGTIIHTGTVNGSIAMYSCLEGHTLIGVDSNRECYSNGTWSGEDPQCRKKSRV